MEMWRHGDMDRENMDMETWTWSHGITVKYWGTLTF
jgi:hypothetical protein